MTRPQLNDARLANVLPELRDKMLKLVALCHSANVEILVTQGLRTVEEQNALFAKGRTVAPIGRSHRVTNARGGQSYHNFGLAVDVVVLDALGKADWNAQHPAWQTMGKLAESIGLEWGARWKSFPDIPHLQLTGGITLPELRAMYPNVGLPGIFANVAKRLHHV